MNEDKIREIVYQAVQATKQENSGLVSDLHKIHKKTQDDLKKFSGIPLHKAFYGVASIFMVWVAWNSVQIYSQNSQLSTVINSQENTASALETYQTATDAKVNTLVNNLNDVKIDVATTKEIVKLMSTRFQINPDAVENRVNRELATTSNNPVSLK